MIVIRIAEFVQPKTDLSLYAVAEKSGLSYTMLHNLKSKRKTSVNTDSLDKIIFALRELTEKSVTVSDLLEYVPDKPSKTKK